MNYTGYKPIHANDQLLATSTTAAPSNAAPKGTAAVRINALTVDVHVRLDGTAATTASPRIPAGGTEYFPASADMTVSAITAAGTGNITITWMRNPV